MKRVEEILHYYREIDGVYPACNALPSMSEEVFEGLVDSITKRGLLEPIMLTEDNMLLDGRHRLMACFEANQEVRFEHTKADPWAYVHDRNILHRDLTVGQKAMYAQSWFEHEKGLAKERQRASGGDRKSEQVRKSVVATLPQPIADVEKPKKSRDRTAAAVGVGQKAITKAAKIVEVAPDLAEDVREGRIDLEPAYREARKIEQQKKSHVIEEPDPLSLEPNNMDEMTSIVTVDGKRKEKPQPKTVRFNQTNDSIDWARWSWNPVTGCNHGCSFCYAREIALSDRMAESYPFGFEPSFHESRLAAPSNTRCPHSEDARENRVFVCSMADLFGKWVPDEWIQKVFESCLRAPDWEYLFLTKWPNRYSKMPLLEKAWYGASVIQQSDVARVEKAMKVFDAPGSTKWISMEPMLEPIRFNDLSWCDLLVIGSQTRTNQPDGVSPAIPADFDSVVDVVNQCREFGVPYYLKANLGLEQPGMRLPKMLPRS